jgi:hypothetical protein
MTWGCRICIVGRLTLGAAAIIFPVLLIVWR